MTYVRASNTKKSLLWIPTGKKENISENIIRQIIDAIKAKEISPCDKIQGEIELAAKFGVSRNSVREALNALTWFGVLEKKQGSGTLVSEQALQKINSLELIRSLSTDLSMLDISEIRMMLDSQIAFWVAERASDNDIEELDIIVQDERARIENREFDEKFLEEPSLFHIGLAEKCGNNLALKLFETLTVEINDSHKNYFLKTTDKEIIRKKVIWNCNDHEKILEKIKQRDCFGAHEVMRRHLFTMLVQMVENEK